MKLLLLELSYNIKKTIEHVYIYAFYVLSIFILMLSFKSANPQEILPVWLCIFMLFTAILASMFWWNEDDTNGYIEQWRLAPIAMEAIVSSRWLMYMLLTTLPLAVLTYGWLQLQGLDKGAGCVAIIIAIAGAQMASITMLMAAITRGARQVAGILAVIVMPLAIPTVLFASQSVGQALSQGASSNAFSLLIGYACFTIPLAIIATAANLRSGD
jgi:heme exporter protein B